jgi:hypothetical protein
MLRKFDTIKNYKKRWSGVGFTGIVVQNKASSDNSETSFKYETLEKPQVEE